MKKIGILTFHRSLNYGAFLQSYSLVWKVRELFPECSVEIIDYTTKKSYQRDLTRDLKTCIKKPWRIYERFTLRKNFLEAQKKLPLSGEKIISDDYNAFLSGLSNQYDVIIVGSDVVFNLKTRGFPNAYWLNGDLGCKKVSYAASSHGTDYDELTGEQQEYCQSALEDFAYIGVRDESTRNFIQRLGGSLTPVQNCDPTLFYDFNHHEVDLEGLKNKFWNQYKLDFNKKTICLMTSNSYIGAIVKERYQNQYNIVTVYEMNQWIKAYLYDLNPFEWARIFTLFDLTITTFFHGALFSLKNGTPVIGVNWLKYDEKYKGKVEDLLNRLGMDHCFYRLSDICGAAEIRSSFFNVIDELIQTPPKQEIAMKLKEEKTYFNSFENCLRELIK